MPPEIRKLAAEELHSPETVSVTPEEITVERIEQRMLEVEPRGKLDALDRLLKAETPRCAIIFARTKIGCQRLADDLSARGHRVRALHGDMSQGARDSVMIAFRGDRVRILVATDVAARGLDVAQVSHVINYDLPDEPEVYVHRIGRTGRAGRDGKAISLVTQARAAEARRDREAARDPDPEVDGPGDEVAPSRRRPSQAAAAEHGAEAARHAVTTVAHGPTRPATARCAASGAAAAVAAAGVPGGAAAAASAE